MPCERLLLLVSGDCSSPYMAFMAVVSAPALRSSSIGSSSCVVMILIDGKKKGKLRIQSTFVTSPYIDGTQSTEYSKRCGSRIRW